MDRPDWSMGLGALNVRRGLYFFRLSTGKAPDVYKIDCWTTTWRELGACVCLILPYSHGLPGLHLSCWLPVPHWVDCSTTTFPTLRIPQSIRQLPRGPSSPGGPLCELVLSC